MNILTRDLALKLARQYYEGGWLMPVELAQAIYDALGITHDDEVPLLSDSEGVVRAKGDVCIVAFEPVYGGYHVMLMHPTTDWEATDDE
jgi:hypothetical protein